MRDNVIAGIVLYNPEIERLFLGIESVINQVSCVCLFDNNSNNIEEIKRKINALTDDRIILLESDENKGIGYALNRICEYALDNNYNWLLTLDHDTICPPQLVQIYQKYIDISDIGMFCPNVIDRTIARNAWNTSETEAISYVNNCIQSGALVKLSVWKSLQGFDEWMFVDFVDFDFCKKLQISNYKICKCNEIIIDHEFGKKRLTKNHAFFQKMYEKTNIIIFKYLTYINITNAARVYYCTRNNIVYIKKYKSHINMFRELYKFWMRIIKRIIRCNNRGMIFCQTIRGIRDGLKQQVVRYVPYKNEE